MITFTAKSNIVKDYVLLIKIGEKTIDDVPNYSNLREVVTDEVAKS